MLALSIALVCPAVGAEAKLKVLTTFLPGYSLALQVAGENATVENLLPGNVSLHDYQLSPGDIRKIAAADVIVINGLGMETFLDQALRSAATKPGRVVVALTEGLKGELIEEGGQDHDHTHDGHGHDHEANPHAWLDPLLAAHGVTNIATALAAADAARAGEYRENAGEVVERLKRLDEEIRSKLEPVRNAAFVTYHNAFPYFTRRYGLNLAGVVEEVPEVSPSPRELSALHRTIREKQVKAIFTEPGETSRLARQIAADGRIKLGELDPLETGELKATAYEEGMRRNVESLLKALK